MSLANALAQSGKVRGAFTTLHEVEPDTPLLGTSKNYLHCHHCVKNKLKMLIYSS